MLIKRIDKTMGLSVFCVILVFHHISKVLHDELCFVAVEPASVDEHSGGFVDGDGAAVAVEDVEHGLMWAEMGDCNASDAAATAILSLLCAGWQVETHDSVQIRNICRHSCLRFQTTSGSVGYNVGV